MTSCETYNVSSKKNVKINKNFFSNTGFTLIYNDNLYIDKLISKKLDERSLLIFQKNLKYDTMVKITNLINNKSIIAKVSKNSDYPIFYNSVISRRILIELDLDINEPYIQIKEIFQNSSFIAKKAKTFEEERNVASKVPIDEINIKNLSSVSKKKKTRVKKKEFNYIIKIADFYFKDSANNMRRRILEESKIKKVQIKKISHNSFRVFLGPFTNLNSLKTQFNAISNLSFENIEIIKK